MARTSFVRFRHTCDILSKSFKTNDTGQREPVWSVVSKKQPCFMTPSSVRASIRVAPSAEEGDFFTLFLPLDVDVKYSSRIKNVKYRNTTLYNAEYEVQDIKLMTGFSGAGQFNKILVRRVIE